MIHLTPKIRVRAGVALLDQKDPGWRDDVQSELVMQSCNNCVLGQAFGLYERGLSALFIDRESEREFTPWWTKVTSLGVLFGFDAHSDREEKLQPSTQDQYEELERLWTKAIYNMENF